MKDVLALIRIKHWIKNIIILIPVCFIGINAWKGEDLLHLLYVFVSFCIAASIIYVINDLVDRESDRLHPKKKERPLASGKIQVYQAYLILSALIVFLGSFLWITKYFNYYCLIYLLLNLGYSFWLKKIPIIDLMAISACYILRLFAGIYALKVSCSFWIMIAVCFITLSIIAAKRRNEIVKIGNEIAHRKVLGRYNLEFLNYITLISAIIAINSYILYVYEQISQNNFNLVVMSSIPLILFGVFKYLFNVFIDNQGGDPVEEIFKDKSLMLVSMLFLVISFCSGNYGENVWKFISRLL